MGVAEGSQLGREERTLNKFEKVKLYAREIQQVPTDEGGGLQGRERELLQQLEKERQEAQRQIQTARERAEVSDHE